MTQAVAENLIKALGIETLPDEQKARILDQCAGVIEQRLMLRLMESLPEEKQTELGTLVKDGKDQAINDFLGEMAPNFEDWIVDEAAQLKDELRGLGEIDI